MTGKPALRLLGTGFSIHRLAPDAVIPRTVIEAPFFWIGKTDEEVSVVCPSAIDLLAEQSEPGWSCLKVEGPIDFAVTGLLADITGRIAAAGIGIFALSTYDTDYVLVRADRVSAAVSVLRDGGYAVSGSGPETG